MCGINKTYKGKVHTNAKSFDSFTESPACFLLGSLLVCLRMCTSCLYIMCMYTYTCAGACEGPELIPGVLLGYLLPTVFVERGFLLWELTNPSHLLWRCLVSAPRHGNVGAAIPAWLMSPGDSDSSSRVCGQLFTRWVVPSPFRGSLFLLPCLAFVLCSNFCWTVDLNVFS